MIYWSIDKVELPLWTDWAISRSTTKVKTNFLVKVSDDKVSAYGEVAFNVRYNESEELILSQFQDFLNVNPEEIDTVKELFEVLSDLEIASSLRFGIESAFVHYMSELLDADINEVLGISKAKVHETSFSLPVMDPSKIKGFIDKNNLRRFNCLKIKVNNENAVDLVKAVNKSYEGMLRIDANESFNDPSEVVKSMEKLVGLPIQFFEQPLKADEHDAALQLKKDTLFPLIADESLTCGEVTSYYKERFHGINVKLMKAGGYFKAIKQMADARDFGLRVMIGCMIETGIGISSALRIAHAADFVDLDGNLFLTKDPFPLCIEEGGKVLLSSYL